VSVVKARLLSLAFILLLLPCVAKEPTQVLFFFDTEDFIRPQSADAIRDLARILEAEGVKGQFALIGYLGKKLVDWRRFDVLDALKGHWIGTQTLYHSVHPNITEFSDVEDFDGPYLRAMGEESRALGMLQAATGTEKIWCSVMPGNGNTIVGLYLYADLGIPFFGGGTGVYDDCTHCGDIWYCNQRHLNYAYSLRLEEFLDKWDEPSVRTRMDELATRKVVTFYMHPHMAVCTRHWDYVFAGGNNYAFGEWPCAPARDPQVTATFYGRLRTFLRMLKDDPRFAFSDCPSLDAARKPAKPITRAEIPAVRRALLKELAPVRTPGEWSIADCFQAAVRLLRGESAYHPGKVYGFLSAPKGVTAPTTVTASALTAAATTIDLACFLPASVDVGGQSIGPADFLYAALEVLETGAREVTVTPRDQLGEIARYLPKLAKADFREGWIYAPTYKDAWTSNRLRWQFWTFRYE